jgi:hypothetical protein
VEEAANRRRQRRQGGMMKVLNTQIVYDEERDQIGFITAGGSVYISATNNGATWKAAGETLVRSVKAFGKQE